MATKSLLRPKYERNPAGNGEVRHQRVVTDGDNFDESDSEEENEGWNSESSGEDVNEDDLTRLCQTRFTSCCSLDRLDSSGDSEDSFVPPALKKIFMKKRRSNSMLDPRGESQRRVRNRFEKTTGQRNNFRPTKNLSNASFSSKSTNKSDLIKVVNRARKVTPSKDEAVYQKAAKRSIDGMDLEEQSSRALEIGHKTSERSRRKSRRSLVDILLDPNLDQKELEKIVTEMHNAARDNRVKELEGYLQEVRKAMRKLDEDGVMEVDDDFADLGLDEGYDEVEDSGKMDGQAMRAMLTALAGREAKEDAVASVANVGASWRTVPHDQLNSCLSMDPKLLDDHRQRLKKNYEEFDKIFQTRPLDRHRDMQHDEGDEERDNVTNTLREEAYYDSKSMQQQMTKEGNEENDDQGNIAHLTREQLLEIHDKIGPWVHNHTKKLDKFIQSKKYTPQYLLNHWNGELSDDDSEVDFEKHRSAWHRKLEEAETPAEVSQEGQPAPQPQTSPTDHVPTLQDNNWFLFPTPMTRSYSTKTDELGSDGQRTRPFSQVAMEGLVKHLRRQQEVEKSRRFQRENPWPPPSRYPPEFKSEPDVKYSGNEIHGEEDEG